jgi:hypothetical protein
MERICSSEQGFFGLHGGAGCTCPAELEERRQQRRPAAEGERVDDLVATTVEWDRFTPTESNVKPPDRVGRVS